MNFMYVLSPCSNAFPLSQVEKQEYCGKSILILKSKTPTPQVDKKGKQAEKFTVGKLDTVTTLHMY